jgi:hypothetical protein
MTAAPGDAPPVQRHATPILLRELTADDHAQVSQLTERNGIRTEPFERWRHLWLSNPAYKKARTRWPLGWVLEDTDGRIVGHLANIPLEYVWRGCNWVAATSRTWVVDRAFRGFAPLLLDSHFRQANVDIFVHPTVNAEASAAYAAFEAHRVPVGRWDHAVFWITGYHGLMRAWLKMKQVPLSAALSYGGAAALFLTDKLKAKPHPQTTEIHFQECYAFDDRFERFWQELQARDNHLLLAVRSREALQWHFKYALEDKRAFVITATRGHRIYAYAIFLRYDNRSFGLRRIRLVDFQAVEDTDAALIATLLWIKKKCRRESIHTFEIVGIRPGVNNIIKALAPYSRSLSTWLYYYQVPNPSLAKQLADPEVWNPCTYDGDASL